MMDTLALVDEERNDARTRALSRARNEVLGPAVDPMAGLLNDLGPKRREPTESESTEIKLRADQYEREILDSDDTA